MNKASCLIFVLILFIATLTVISADAKSDTPMNLVEISKMKPGTACTVILDRPNGLIEAKAIFRGVDYGSVICQIDAPIVPGDSGAPLYAPNHRLIGGDWISIKGSPYLQRFQAIERMPAPPFDANPTKKLLFPDIKPGKTLCIPIIRGDTVGAYKNFVVTARQGNYLICQAHGNTCQGPCALPVCRSRVVGITADGKEIIPVGKSIGTVIDDTDGGLLVQLIAFAPIVRTRTTTRFEYRHSVSRHEIAIDDQWIDNTVLALSKPVSVACNRTICGQIKGSITIDNGRKSVRAFSLAGADVRQKLAHKLELLIGNVPPSEIKLDLTITERQLTYLERLDLWHEKMRLDELAKQPAIFLWWFGLTAFAFVVGAVITLVSAKSKTTAFRIGLMITTTGIFSMLWLLLWINWFPPLK